MLGKRTNRFLAIFWSLTAATFLIASNVLSAQIEDLHKIQDGQIDYRLPSKVAPVHYDLYLHPDLTTGSFTGQELITVRVQETTKQIILHSNNLTINNVYVLGPSLENLQVDDYEFDFVKEFLIINMVEELEAGLIKLGIMFEGIMEDKIVGLYSSSYLTPDKENRKIATSKFEPTYARQAFPCFDEPAFKATFNVTLVRPTDGGYHALSNMNELSSQYLGQFTEVSFAESVPMSTYVSCFIVSDLDSRSGRVNTNGIGNDFNIRIFATKHQMDKVNFALSTGIKVTEYYIQYFNIEYPLPKLDMAAIPDFVSNAMEHWGLLTYRETALLYDPSISSTHNKQRVAAVVAHELAHMWFGNLVTMMWWNDLWLNEGFARFLQYKGINEVYPDWDMNDIFLLEVPQSVMKFDSRTSSHPIIQTVVTPDQITEVFDTISYEKGASIIRMLENLISPIKFRQAVENYLRTYKYSNAVTNDFIAELEKQNLNTVDIRQFMRTWTEQMGYPVISVTRTMDSRFEIRQKRFFSNKEDYDLHVDASPFNYTWDIPLTYITDESSEQKSVMFSYNANSVEIVDADKIKWIKLNVQQNGYYRVNYDKELWKVLTETLIEAPTTFSIADRANLLDDVFALADANQLDYDTSLDLIAYLEKEYDFVPWAVATTKLQDLARRLSGTKTAKDFLTYARDLIRKVYNEVTWTVDADNHQKNRLRVSVLTAACFLGLPECLETAAEKFISWLSEPHMRPSPDLREIIYFFGMQSVNDEKAWNQMWELFITETDASEKLKLMYGLSAIREPWILHRFAELASNENYVRRQDYFTCLQNIAANPVGEPIIWDYVREQWPALVDRFTLNERYLGRMIPSITSYFSTMVRLEEIQNFFDKYPDAGAGATARLQAIETTKYNIKWLEVNYEKISSWLQKYSTNKAEI